MRDFLLSLLCVAVTLLVYALNKRLYRRWRTLLLMPLVMTPLVLVALLLLTHISWLTLSVWSLSALFWAGSGALLVRLVRIVWR